MPSAGVEQEQHAGKALGRAPGCCLDAFKISSKGSQDGKNTVARRSALCTAGGMSQPKIRVAVYKFGPPRPEVIQANDELCAAELSTFDGNDGTSIYTAIKGWSM